MFGMFRYKGLFDAADGVPFGLAQLQADPNVVLIQDPSAIWGGADMLASGATETQKYQHAATKNVPWLRRNIFVPTDNISGVVIITTVNATPNADGFLETTATGVHSISPLFSVTIPAGTVASWSVTLAGIGRTEATIQFGTATNAASNYWGGLVDFVNHTISGIFTNGQSGTTYTISADPLGGTRITCTATIVDARTNISMRIYGSVGGSLTYAGDITKGYSVLRPQIELGAVTPYQPITTSWPASYTALAQAAGAQIISYADRAGTTATDYSDVVVGKLLDLSGDNNHATAPSDAARPLLKKSAGGYWYLLRDGVDDNLQITFTNLGANCVTYVNDGTQIIKTTGVTLNGEHNTTTPTNDYGRIYCASPPTAAREAQIIKYLKAKAGLS